MLRFLARTIRRVTRFYVHASLWWFAGLAALFVYLLWRLWDKPGPLAAIYAGAVAIFVLPAFVSSALALRFGKIAKVLRIGPFIALAAVAVLVRTRHQTPAIFLFTYYLALHVGIMFWAVTDDLYQIISWLSHPLEYGYPPDEIHLLAERRGKERIDRLWRYRYDEKWDVAITGFETFAFEDGRCNEMSPEQIFDEYRGWYEREGIEALRQKAIDSRAKR